MQLIYRVLVFSYTMMSFQGSDAALYLPSVALTLSVSYLSVFPGILFKSFYPILRSQSITGTF